LLRCQATRHACESQPGPQPSLHLPAFLMPATRGRLDVGTHCGGGYRPALPRSQASPDTTPEFEQILELAIKLKGLVAQEPMHVGARRAPPSANRDDLLPLRKCHAEHGGSPDEAHPP